jgi:hypothetical protein
MLFKVKNTLVKDRPTYNTLLLFKTFLVPPEESMKCHLPLSHLSSVLGEHDEVITLEK